MNSVKTKDNHELTNYLVGFGLSIVLTLIAFGAVMFLKDTNVSTIAIATIVFGCAIVQILVQVVYFLHIKKEENDGWNLAALLFTIVILVIIIGGSVWVMYHLHMNMMPELN